MSVPRVWIPCRARFVPLFAYAGAAPRGHLPTPLPRQWPSKRATDLFDYGLDCRDYLAGVGDTIASYGLAIDQADLQASLVVNIGGVLIVWLSGGTPGAAYTATWTIMLRNSGQRIVAPIAIRVLLAPSLPAPELPTLAVRPSQAVPLLARDGTPLLSAGGALSSAATTTDGAAFEVEGGGVLLFRP
jgi:hypothetical protein